MRYLWASLVGVAALIALGVGSFFFLGDEEPIAAVPTTSAATPTTSAATPATSAATATPATSAATPATSAATPATGGSISALQDVQNATIQIKAQGSFVDPQVGLQSNAAGSGSGFIIDKSGIAVTNNHVVTGAALLKVYVAGESEPRNARVLGASECSDLALIDIEGDDLPYLDWYEGDINVGLEIYAAGFPLGDPEFTLTRGIVSKASANGETNWASIDSVIEHDATINPGNSGGPLVNGDGSVVGVNYAQSPRGTNQFFAIARHEAVAMIDQLRHGDVTSIGINGTAINTEEGLAGIWVSSVKSGSPADNARVEAGDIILSMEGLDLATDGTMSDYCDILRSRNPDDPMHIEVLRFATEEVLEGQINGRVLMQTISFAQALDEKVEEETTGSATTYSNYVTISDETNQIKMEVPAEWNDIDGSPWIVDGEEIGVTLSASANLAAYNSSWTEPGVFFAASRVVAQSMNEETIVDLLDLSDECQYEERKSYEDALYTGVYDVWTNCDGEDVIFLVLSVVPEHRAFVALLTVQIASEADVDALDHIFDSFIVADDLQ